MKQQVQRGIKQQLAKQHACYVLITCNKPATDGKMQVEMTYEGDALLASYLIHGAQSLIDECLDENEELVN